jgi:uncharacterized protein YlxW (UPF0749 family)
LSLLERIAADALNPAYPTARSDHRASGSSGRGGKGSGVLLTMVALALVGLLVGVLVLGSRQQSQAASSERRGLIELATAARADADALEAQVTALDDEVTALREASLTSAALGGEIEQRIARLEVAAGSQPVTGPGARVVVEDADAATGGTDADLSQVLDIDLQQVVNGLWEAGAEAVAVNGERVAALTAIRSVQDVILVNYDPIVSPYVVEAVGDPRTLATDFLRSSGGRWLQAVNLSAGIRFSIDSVTDGVLLPGQPVGSLRHASPAGDIPEVAP